MQKQATLCDVWHNTGCFQQGSTIRHSLAVQVIVFALWSTNLRLLVWDLDIFDRLLFDRILNDMPEAGVRFPNLNAMVNSSRLIQDKEPLLESCFAFVDGLHIQIQNSMDHKTQNSYYKELETWLWCSQLIFSPLIGGWNPVTRGSTLEHLVANVVRLMTEELRKKGLMKRFRE
jgi:hypothetical protein